MILKNLTQNYSTIPNEIIADTSISAGAFRLYCYLASKPESWEVNNSDIRKQLKIGSNNSLNKYWKELIDTSWIEKVRHKDKKGKFTGKTILILHNTQNRKNCENGKNPLSQKIHYRKNCEIAKSAKHSNTEYISNTDINSNTDNINKKTNKEISEKFSITSALQKSDIQQLLSDLQVDENFLYELDNHRKSINKPIVNIKALIATLKDIIKASILTKRSANEILTIMEEQGWKSVKAEWVNNLEGKSKGKTILILNNSKNIDKTESSETPISVFDGKRDKTESSETRKHSNTKPISKTNNIKNNKKEPVKEKDITKTSTKEENSQLIEEKRESIQRLMSLIRDFYKEKNLSLNGGKVFKYEKTFFDLLKNYSLKDIEEIIKFGMKDKFYSKLITIPSSLFNNFESMKLAYEEQEEPHFKSALDFYEINLPEGWIL